MNIRQNGPTKKWNRPDVPVPFYYELNQFFLLPGGNIHILSRFQYIPFTYLTQ